MLYPYLQVISQMHHPERDRHNYCNSQKNDDNGTEFFSEDRKITSKFYDVNLRTNDPRAKGRLKFEVSIINTANILNYILTPNQLVGDLTEDLMKKILNDELTKIGMNRPQKHLICLTDALIAGLHRKKYDVIKFKGIYQYICINWGKSTRQLAEDLGVTQEIIRDRKKEITGMGGPFLDFSNKRKDLPGLVVQ